MTSFHLIVASALLLVSPLIAVAAPGDPRLVNGVLEWPRAVTNETFVLVRGEDGVLYHIGVGAARREASVVAGARVSVLGIEGRSPHEITAFALASGPTADAALAQLQAGRLAAPVAPAPAQAPPSATASTVAVAPTPTPSTTPPATVAAPPATASTAAVAAPAPGPAAPASPAAPAATPAPAATSAPVAAPAPAAPAAPAPVAPAPVAPAPVAAPVPVAASSTTPGSRGAAAPATGGVAAVAPPPVVATAPLVPVDERRWTELTGEVEAFVGRTLILKVDGGRVSVDVSSLSGNLERMVAPGTKIKVYGVPVELRFKAMGFIDPDARARTR